MFDGDEEHHEEWYNGSYQFEFGTWSKSRGGTIVAANASDSRVRSVEKSGAEGTNVGCDIAVGRHSLLEHKGDVEIRRRVESHVTEAGGRRGVQSLQSFAALGRRSRSYGRAGVALEIGEARNERLHTLAAVI